MPKVVDVEQRKTELAAAVARVIARSGIEGASMRQVAAEAGWTTGTLVHYFSASARCSSSRSASHSIDGERSVSAAR